MATLPTNRSAANTQADHLADHNELARHYNLSVEKLAESVLSASAATVTFSSIPQDFTHLYLRCQSRTDKAAYSDGVGLRFNGDSGTNYLYQYTSANETNAPSSGKVVSQAQGYAGDTVAATAGAGWAGASTVVIENYRGTAFWKHFHAQADFLGSGAAMYQQSLYNVWQSAAAITSITLLSIGGANFVTGSTFSLYGER